jgi:PAS domain S-box-containing protein
MGAKQVNSERTTELVDQLLEAAPGPMVLLNTDFRIARVNPQAEKLVGYCQEELLGQKRELLMPEVRGSRNLKSRSGQVVRSQMRLIGHGLESVVRHRDGTEIPVVINMGLLQVGAHTLISGVLQKVPRGRGDELDLRAVVDASDDAIIGTDLDGIIVSWNKGAEKICGYTAEEILGKPVSIFLPPGYFNEHTGNMIRLWRGEHTRFEATRIHKNGYPIDLSITIAPVKNRDGIVVGASVVARDITHHKEVRNAILGLRALVDASDDAIIGKTIDGTIISWNKGAEKIYGYKAEEIVGQSISVLMPPDQPDEFPKIMARLGRGEHIEKYETKRIHKDGHLIDISVTISPVKGRDGTVVGASVVARDITFEKRAAEALRLSEERFRVALKSASVMVFSQDLQLRYTWISAPVLGLAREDYLGRTDAEVFPGEDGASLTAIKREVLRTGIESHAEVTVTLKGAMHHFDLLVEPLRDSGGQFVGLLCSAIDITSLKEAIGRLQQALDEVQLLKGLLPICASCKRIKDEHEIWQVLESYIQTHSAAKFSHGICPECMRKLYPDYRP